MVVAEERKILFVEIRGQIHRDVSKLAIDQGLTKRELTEQALLDYLRKHQKKVKS